MLCSKVLYYYFDNISFQCFAMWYMGALWPAHFFKGGSWNPLSLFTTFTTNFISLYFLYTPTTFHMTPHILTFSYIFGKCYCFLFYINPIKMDNNIEYYVDPIKMDNDREYYIDPIKMNNDREYYIDPIKMDNDREYYINTISYILL